MPASLIHGNTGQPLSAAPVPNGCSGWTTQRQPVCRTAMCPDLTVTRQARLLNTRFDIPQAANPIGCDGDEVQRVRCEVPRCKLATEFRRGDFSEFRIAPESSNCPVGIHGKNSIAGSVDPNRGRIYHISDCRSGPVQGILPDANRIAGSRCHRQARSVEFQSND